MTAPQTTEDGSRARFPALDPEPAHRPVPWRLLAGVLALALVAAGAAELSFALTGKGHSAAGTSRRTGGQRAVGAVTEGGQILAEDSSGHLVLVSPNADGAHPAVLRSLGTFPPTPPALWSEGPYLLNPAGNVVSFAQPHHPAVRRSAAVITPRMLPAAIGPFADHGQYLLLRPSFYGEPVLSMPVDLSSIATGKTVRLGSGDIGAGDPQAVGAFVAVAGPLAHAGANGQVFPDSRVELRDAGAKPVVLGTARQLDRAVGEPARLKVSLEPIPSPDGGKVAIEVTPLTPGSLSGIVVVSRTGRVLDSVPLSLGAESGVFWNPAGSAFAFISRSSFGPALTVTTLGGGAQTQAFPPLASTRSFAITRFQTCVWSPDGTAILCSDSKGSQWAVAHAAGGMMVIMAGHGIPIGWYR